MDEDEDDFEELDDDDEDEFDDVCIPSLPFTMRH